MYPLKVQKCPRVKSMMIVRLIRVSGTRGNDADDGEVSSYICSGASGQRDGRDGLLPPACNCESTYSNR